MVLINLQSPPPPHSARWIKCCAAIWQRLGVNTTPEKTPAAVTIVGVSVIIFVVIIVQIFVVIIIPIIVIIIVQIFSDLEFVATVATGGHVKFLSAV